MASEVILDGSEGEGGGQILRTALTMSMITGRPFHMKRIRAKRGKPGLMRQHLTSVQAAAQISGAEARGAALGSQELHFLPGPIAAGDYSFAIGTAGSTTLIFQTLMPALLTTGRPFSLVLEGGTHNPHAPSIDFLAKTYLPCLGAMGVAWDLHLERRGYYPAGGGRWRIAMRPPASLSSLELIDRGPFQSLEARILWAKLPPSVPEKEMLVLRSRLVLDEARITVEEDKDSLGPGNAVLLEIRHERITEVVSAYGERGKSAEAVAEEVVRKAGEYREAGMPVGPHLADQLLVPLVLGGGGVFRTPPLTLHSRTNIETIGKFLDRDIVTTPVERRAVEVRVRPA
ncbi:MAG TPA: RNA 3'-terminal phosphate cyclase [Fibrobacteria bacterium]|nr:RNA 3'-terminal phosphate cyclase [Fibrobacteria bacterium]